MILTDSKASPPPRPNPYLACRMHPEVSETTLTAAYEVVYSWQPQTRFVLHPLAPGWAGLQPYKVEGASGGPAFLKVQSVGRADARPTADMMAKMLAEADRTAWAGDRDQGPRLRFSYGPRAGFVTDWLDGAPITDAEAAGSLMPAFARRMSLLHLCSPEWLPSGGEENWLHAIRPADTLACGTALARADIDAVGRFDNAIETLLARASFRPTPIHNDVHRGNAIRQNGGVLLVDWGGLKLGDPLCDLAHFASFSDVPNNHLNVLLAHWSEGMAHAGAVGMLTDADRLALRVAHFNLRHLAFHGQSPSPLSHYLLWRVRSDAAHLATLMSRELGLHNL